MKKEYRNAIRQGINESELNGYKWTITTDGLKWSYCDEEFTFKYNDLGDGNAILTTHQKGCTEMWTAILIGSNRWDDTDSIEEAYRIATRRTIAKANHLY